MNKTFWLKQLPVTILITGTILGTVAWQNKPVHSKQFYTDTVPERNKKIRDIDDALDEVDKSRSDLDRNQKDIDWQKMDKEMKEAMDHLHIDMEKMKEQISHALKEVDAARIQMDVQKALKEENAEKIKEHVHEAINNIDEAKINEEIARAMKEVDAEKIKAQLDASLAKIDMEKVKKEMEKIRETDMEQMREQMKNIRPQIERSMKQAHESLDKAKKDLLAYKSFINDLDKDGLINKKGTYTIEYKKGNLYINGTNQSSETVKKYNDFLKNKKDFTIKKDEDNFDIHNDNNND